MSNNVMVHGTTIHYSKSTAIATKMMSTMKVVW